MAQKVSFFGMSGAVFQSLMIELSIFLAQNSRNSPILNSRSSSLKFCTILENFCPKSKAFILFFCTDTSQIVQNGGRDW